MSGSSVEQHIDTVDAYARTLYVRTRQDPSLSDIGDAVKQIHVVLRHLRVEAADPDSLLANPESIYSRQLRPLVDSCGSTLNQLEHALDSGSGLSAARSRLKGDKASVDGFLDTVQLQKSKAAVPIVNTDQESLEHIKDKVDNVAMRVFSRRDSGFADDKDRVWKEFKAELEKEGFSPTVLKQHKEVLRAYIRGLESLSLQNGGDPPTVRGLLEYEAESNKLALHSPKELVYEDMENEKFSPSLKTQRRSVADDTPPPLPPKEPLTELESPPPLPPRHSPSPEKMQQEISGDDSMALISTTDIMAMDRLGAGIANIHLDPRSQQQYQLPSSPNPKYLPWRTPDSLMPPDVAELPGSLSTSPQAVPMPNHPHLSTSPNSQGQPRLAPDRYGKAIPMNAQWTKINRSLVSPEVLERAGVRYEARPTYVAILGRFSREQISEFARQSADARAARTQREKTMRKDASQPYAHMRQDSKSSRDDELSDSDLFDESDTTDSDDDRTSEKGTKSYPYIVSPPNKTSPAATVKPKGILKNRNENHVRFAGAEPYEVSNKSPGSRGEERRSRRPEERRRPRDDHRERDSRESRDNYYYRSGGGSGSEHASDRHRPRTYRDDREHHHHRRSAPHRISEREKKSIKKKAWGETLGAVGLGGAAVSLLSVLAEAASAV
jgi:hypothetical protein